MRRDRVETMPRERWLIWIIRRTAWAKGRRLSLAAAKVVADDLRHVPEALVTAACQAHLGDPGPFQVPRVWRWIGTLYLIRIAGRRGEG